jgi:hypothetical protein
MWAFLATLPVWIQFALPISVIFALVIISIFGSSTIKWGKHTLGFGKYGRGRSCTDCILLILSKKERHASMVELVQKSILRDQMNFLEQKIQQVTFTLISSYNKQQQEQLKDSNDPIRNNIEITLYAETLKNAITAIKDETRRSFKENGFHELGRHEFKTYVQDKSTALISIAKNYFINRYPHQGMMISLTERFKKLDESKIEEMVEEVFTKAKEIKNDADVAIKLLNENFAKEMDQFTEK